jgi:hypothetical protein
MSVIYPISRIRLENYVGMIRVKELPVGFRVLSAEAIAIENILPEDQKQDIREIILCNQTKDPEKVWCIVIFEVESIDATTATKNCLFQEYGFGLYSVLAAIQDKATNENGRQAEQGELKRF